MEEQIIGIIAVGLTSLSFLPQIVKSIKIRSVKDLSIFTLAQLSCGVVFWIIYGAYRRDIIIIIANLITLFTLLTLIFLYFLYSKRY